ncbi:MAG: VOC family protein [Alphaproteobacteria bacterium]|nr:VOC family protein [Alphaproteobacteria bacterium]
MSDELRLALDHVSLSVADLGVAKEFYTALLIPVGLELVGEFSAEQSGSVAFAGFGIGRKGQLWLAESGQQTPQAHICFRARTRAEVREFYKVALANGGTDNGPPGIRENYHPSYYAAFVLDPEGHNIEALCLEPEGANP